jgi:signal transduction histidine kinase
VRVADNGLGFQGDLNQLGKLFVRHTRGSGSGVGLYIVHQLVKRMNGTICFTGGGAGDFSVEMSFPNSEIGGTPESSRGTERTGYEATVAGRR